MVIMTQVEPPLLMFGKSAYVTCRIGINLPETPWSILLSLGFNARRSSAGGLRKLGPVVTITVAPSLSIQSSPMASPPAVLTRRGFGAPGVAFIASLVHLASFAALSMHTLRTPVYGASSIVLALLRINVQAWKRTL